MLHRLATRDKQFGAFPRNAGGSTQHETRHGNSRSASSRALSDLMTAVDGNLKTQYALRRSWNLDELTVTDLADIAGASVRSVQHWAASGILDPFPQTNRGGTGTRRLFSADEAIIACIMQPLLDRQMPVGAMLRVSAIVRAHLLSHIGGGRLLLNRVILKGERVWFVDLGNEDNHAAKLVFESDEKFCAVFEGMKANSTALVVDLTAALAGIKGRVEGY